MIYNGPAREGLADFGKKYLISWGMWITHGKPARTRPRPFDSGAWLRLRNRRWLGSVEGFPHHPRQSVRGERLLHEENALAKHAMP